MKKISFLLTTACALLSVGNIFGQLRLPNAISDHMVLQRQATTKIWGWGNPSSTVKLSPSWSSDTLKTTVSGEGRWELQLNTGAAGGPHSFTVISSSDTMKVSDILFGEVWLCSGQSNMEWSALQNLQEIIDILPGLNNPNVRLLNNAHIASASPQDNSFARWQRCDSAATSSFSAIGYFYAEQLSRKLGVPVGVINSSWGGTGAETWTPQEKIAASPVLKEAASKKAASHYKPTLPGRAYNSMIHPLLGYTIAGVLWYQGEDNVGAWDSYGELFSTMIGSWRENWGSDFPFYFAQIAPFTYNNKDLPAAAYLREVQTKVSQNLPKVHMVLTSDLVPDVTNIHPTRKREVAERFVNLALSQQYNKNIPIPFSPTYQGHEIKGDKIVVSFHNMEGQTLQAPKDLKGLFIAGSDKVFHPADFKISGNTLIVHAKAVKQPIAVRYAFSETDLTDLKSSTGLPVSLFRTDDWQQFTVSGTSKLKR